MREVIGSVFDYRCDGERTPPGCRVPVPSGTKERGEDGVRIVWSDRRGTGGNEPERAKSADGESRA